MRGKLLFNTKKTSIYYSFQTLFQHSQAFQTEISRLNIHANHLQVRTLPLARQQ